jgi:hypothetical protein
LVCGERGIIFNDPIGEHLADQITPLFVSLIRSFYFRAVLIQVNLIRPVLK